MKPKFKVGDRVRVKPDKWISRVFGASTRIVAEIDPASSTVRIVPLLLPNSSGSWFYEDSLEYDIEYIINEILNE